MQTSDEIGHFPTDIRRMSASEWSALKHGIVREARIAQAPALRNAFVQAMTTILRYGRALSSQQRKDLMPAPQQRKVPRRKNAAGNSG